MKASPPQLISYSVKWPHHLVSLDLLLVLINWLVFWRFLFGYITVTLEGWCLVVHNKEEEIKMSEKAPTLISSKRLKNMSYALCCLRHNLEDFTWPTSLWNDVVLILLHNLYFRFDDIFNLFKYLLRNILC